MIEQIKQHGENLKTLFNVDIDGDTLSRKIHRIEVKAHRLSTDYCNGVIDGDKWEIETEKILKTLDKVLNFKSQGIPVFVNGDARGYALKIDDSFITGYKSKGGIIYTDWGGYGILAPEFDGN